MNRRLVILFLGFFLSGPALAIDPGDKLEDPELRARYEQLTEQLRCLVCQNQTIADSNAELAQDLREQVREMLRAGRSDEEIAQYMVDRYGDFVLYKPPVRPSTWLLWGGPFILLLLAVTAGGLVIRRYVKRANQELDGDEEDN